MFHDSMTFEFLLSLEFGSCLKTGQHSIFVTIRKIKNDTRMLDTTN